VGEALHVRDLVKIEGRWLDSIPNFDRDSPVLVGAACFDRQNLSRAVRACRQAIAQWGATGVAVSDHAGVFLALSPCLQPLGIRWTPVVRRHPWQNLAEGASPSSAGCSMPVGFAALIGKRCIGSMPSSSKTITSGGVGPTHVRMTGDGCMLYRQR